MVLVAVVTGIVTWLLVVFRVPVGDWVESIVNWLTASAGWLFDFIRVIVNWMTGSLERVLIWPPSYVMAGVFGIVGWRARGLGFGALSFVGFVLIQSMRLWNDAMSTLSLVVVAAFVAVIVGVPLGILAANSEITSRIFRPVLDFMQTLPVFVYLIPAIIFFGIGKVPGVFATVIFAMPPAVRLTELGLRQVDQEVVEAAEAFGAPKFKILRKVQLPLAMPTLMAGVNQVIMLALSMVVTAGIVGAGGLGAVVYRGVTRLDVGLGFEGGLAVVILAIFLDRLTGALSGRKDGQKSTAT
ncbi:MAG: ABC transporter permease subunit [Actinobacteria bacterium]|nr:ABC transporter permease subunit [Actinomycetota bacterium]